MNILYLALLAGRNPKDYIMAPNRLLNRNFKTIIQSVLCLLPA